MTDVRGRRQVGQERSGRRGLPTKARRVALRHEAEQAMIRFCGPWLIAQSAQTIRDRRDRTSDIPRLEPRTLRESAHPAPAAG